MDTSNLPMEPPPPYPLYQQSQQTLQQSTQSHPPKLQQRQPQGGQQQPISPLQNVPLDFNSSAVSSFFFHTKVGGVTKNHSFLVFISVIATLISKSKSGWSHFIREPQASFHSLDQLTQHTHPSIMSHTHPCFSLWSNHTYLFLQKCMSS